MISTIFAHAPFLELITVGLVLFALSFVLSPVFVKMFSKRGLIDQINARSSHSLPTPKGGGVLLIFLILLSFILLKFFTNSALFTQDSFMLAIFAMSIIIAIIGFLDDCYDISWLIRIVCQLLSVSIPLYFAHLALFGLSPLVTKLFLGFGWVWFINLFNFLDALDGYALQETIFICLGISIVLPSLAPLCLCIVAICFGFGRVNFPKAKIFMGDVGSTFLGYILGGLMIYSVSLNQHVFLPLLTLSLLFNFDASFTLIKRALQRKKIWQAHREHWCQRVNIMGFSHKSIFWCGILINVILLVMASFGFYYHLPSYMFLLGLLFCTLICYLIKRGEESGLSAAIT